jgi:hypothetical protein
VWRKCSFLADRPNQVSGQRVVQPGAPRYRVTEPLRQGARLALDTTLGSQVG